jgi:hypothetical protein
MGQKNYIASKSNVRFCDVDRVETSSKHQRRMAEISPIRGGVVSQDYAKLNRPEAHLRGAGPDRARERATGNPFWN